MNHLVVPLTRRFQPVSSPPFFRLCPFTCDSPPLRSPAGGGSAWPPSSPPCVSLHSLFLISPVDFRNGGPRQWGPGPSSLVNPACPLAPEPPLRGGRTPAAPTRAPRRLRSCPSGRRLCPALAVGCIAAWRLYRCPSAVLPPPQTCPETPHLAACPGRTSGLLPRGPRPGASRPPVPGDKGHFMSPGPAAARGVQPAPKPPARHPPRLCLLPLPPPPCLNPFSSPRVPKQRSPCTWRVHLGRWNPGRDG